MRTLAIKLPTSLVTFWAWSSLNWSYNHVSQWQRWSWRVFLQEGSTSFALSRVLNGRLTSTIRKNECIPVLNTPPVLLLLQPSRSQAKLFWSLFRGEPHYVRLNNLYGNSAVKVSFVVMNTDHKLSSELFSPLFFIILSLAPLYFRSTEGIHPTMFASQLFVTQIGFC